MNELGNSRELFICSRPVFASMMDEFMNMCMIAKMSSTQGVTTPVAGPEATGAITAKSNGPMASLSSLSSIFDTEASVAKLLGLKRESK